MNSCLGVMYTVAIAFWGNLGVREESSGLTVFWSIYTEQLVGLKRFDNIIDKVNNKNVQLIILLSTSCLISYDLF